MWRRIWDGRAAVRLMAAPRDTRVMPAVRRGGSGSKSASAGFKTIALLRKVRHRGVSKVHWVVTLAGATYNLVRMRNLAAAAAAT